MAVLRQAVGLLSLPGLPVSSLRLPVNPESPQTAALVRTIGLSPPAPPAYEETHAAPSAMNLDKKQSGLQPCKQSEAVVEIWRLWGFRSFRSSLSEPEVGASGFLFLSFQPFGESTKKALLYEKGPRVDQNGGQLYRWVILCERRSGGSKSVVVLSVGHSTK